MAGARAHPGYGALDTFGLFERYTGTLVSDDYNGYAKYQVREGRGRGRAPPPAWAAATIEVLRAARKSVKDTTAPGRSALTGQDQIREVGVHLLGRGLRWHPVLSPARAPGGSRTRRDPHLQL